MVNVDLNCEFCDKVYIRKGALQNHIKSKHQDKRQPNQQDQGQIFQNIDIPEDFPGGEEEILIEAAESYELEEAARGVEEQLDQHCDNCANIRNIEKRLTLKRT